MVIPIAKVVKLARNMEWILVKEGNLTFHRSGRGGGVLDYYPGNSPPKYNRMISITDKIFMSCTHTRNKV